MWPFRRRRRPTPLPPPPDCWHAGDLAECVRDDWVDPGVRPPLVGARALVLDVEHGPDESGREGVWLNLLGYPHAWYAGYFRKIVENGSHVDRTVARRRPVRAREPA